MISFSNYWRPSLSCPGVGKTGELEEHVKWVISDKPADQLPRGRDRRVVNLEDKEFIMQIQHKLWGAEEVLSELCYWQEHSHVRKPIPQSGNGKVFYWSMWMLTVYAENVSLSFLLPDVYSLGWLFSRVLTLRLANPPPCAEHTSCWVSRLNSRCPPPEQEQSTQSQLFCIYSYLFFIPKSSQARLQDQSLDMTSHSMSDLIYSITEIPKTYWDNLIF